MPAFALHPITPLTCLTSHQVIPVTHSIASNCHSVTFSASMSFLCFLNVGNSVVFHLQLFTAPKLILDSRTQLTNNSAHDFHNDRSSPDHLLSHSLYFQPPAPWSSHQKLDGCHWLLPTSQWEPPSVSLNRSWWCHPSLFYCHCLSLDKVSHLNFCKIILASKMYLHTTA